MTTLVASFAAGLAGWTLLEYIIHLPWLAAAGDGRTEPQAFLADYELV